METGQLPPHSPRRLPGLSSAALASLGAGAVHAAATGMHAGHPQLARLFVVFAALELGVGMWALLRPGRAAAWGIVLVNAAAVTAWLGTRVMSISWVDGLQHRGAAQFADTACALLGAAAAGAALASLLIGWRESPPARLALPALAVAALAIPAMFVGGTHTTTEAAIAAGPGGQVSSATDPTGGTATTAATDTTVHNHDTSTTGTAADWPRPYDPSKPLDLSGVPGVTAAQQARATKLIEDTLRILPRWSTTAAAVADGYKSIGDAGTGSEHYIKLSLINDNVMLDPNQPESLVYTVKGASRTLAGAMFIASARKSDDPTLTNWAGALMTWHNHGNLCWAQVNGKATVVGITDANGKCARGVNTGGENPMVHVWITPQQCGPFSALEGVGAGQAAVPEAQRVDQCHAHSHTSTGTGTTTSAVTHPYDPTKPIDLSGTPGVTPQQQAAAENLVAVTVVRLPKWADYHTAEAAGFHSIGDGLTGFEHFINWKWINDKVWMDPDHPESLVYQVSADGSKKLVSAMYMLPDTLTLDKVPDIGGALMQWHIHDNLCFTTDPVAPHVAGLTDGSGKCAPGLQTFVPSPMIHVWIVPQTCGPFSALEGVGAGQILPGQERLCDHVHGSGF